MRGKKKGKRSLLMGAVLCVCLTVAGCGDSKTEQKEEMKVEQTVVPEATPEAPVFFTEEGQEFQSVEEYVYTTSKLNVRAGCSTDSEVIRMLPERAKILRVGVGDTWSKISLDEGEYYVATEYLATEAPKLSGHLIALDAGHQETADETEEAIGPGATETKARATIGTKGVSTGVQEYQLTLEVAQLLKTELQERGYEVFMVRESHDVNLSTHERAEMAAEAGAEILVRLHANGSKVTETNGAMTICGTKDSPYVADLYGDSHRLAGDILSHYVQETGAQDKGIWETDVMAGINWSTIPVTILEMGFLSNEQEDKNMNEDSYQAKMVKGIADGIDAYYAGNSASE